MTATTRTVGKTAAKTARTAAIAAAVAFVAVLLAGGAGGCSSNPKDSASDGGAGAGGSGGGAAGAGGSGSGAGGGGGGEINCGDPNIAIDPTAIIDDMEATDPPTLRVGGRTGGWWAGGDDQSADAQIQPDGDAPAELIPGGGRCGSQYAMRVTGRGFTQWAVLSVSMKYGSADGSAPGLLPYDAHAYTGITFWAHVGDTSANQVRVGISDKYTRPEGGICDEAPGASPDVACFDYMGVDMTLGTSWRQYKIPFAGLGQQSFGLHEDALDTTSIITIEFNFPLGKVFDFWLDDLSFY